MSEISSAESAPAHRGTRLLSSALTLFRRNRLLWIVAASAVISLVTGLLVGALVIAPADAVAEAPDAGLITVPVEYGELRNDLTIRGDVAYADAVEVVVDMAGSSEPAVVTGQVPAVGSELNALSIALEVAGRPMIVLPGELPAYRTLRFGLSGPDVTQFKQAMRTLGIDGGDPADDTFDAQSASAVTALYAKAGYPPPRAEDGAEESVRAAEDAVSAAEQGVAAARTALSRAQAGPSEMEIREADTAVSSAQRALAAAQRADPPDELQIADLKDALGLAELRRTQLRAAPDARDEHAAVESARSSLAQAQRELQRAAQDALPVLPAGEVVYLTELPRRVDAVTAQRGAVVEGPAMTVSGAKVELLAAASSADAQLVEVGDEAVFDLPGGGEHRAVVGRVEEGAKPDARWLIALTPDALTPDQITELEGGNVRVRVPISATDTEVLYVPAAALTAGPGGETRVEVVDGDPRDPDRAESRIVVVETGLATAGGVEIRPVEGELAAGDLVVVGR